MAGVKGRSGGHNAKPVAQHKLQGTFQKVRHDGIVNPDPPKGIPVRPKGLKGDARREWDRMIGWLNESKALSTVDAAALFQYCQMFGRVERIAADQELARRRCKDFENRLEDVPPDSIAQAYETLERLQKAVGTYDSKIRMGQMGLLRYLTEFGLTPASRGRVKLAGDGEKPDDAFGDLEGDDDDAIH